MKKIAFGWAVVAGLLSLVSCGPIGMVPAMEVELMPEEVVAPSEDAGIIISHEGFVLAYNVGTNLCDWVAWELRAEELEGEASRGDYDFEADPEVPMLHRVNGWDYKKSGYQRGHMCPAADMKWSERAMNDCHYMSNICPQSPKLNMQWWEHLERACRRWADEEHEGVVYVICGPIVGQNPQTIGRDVEVAVPEAFFKVVYSLRPGHEKALGFYYRNTDERQTMDDAVTTVDEIEKLTGLDFMPVLDDNVENAIEAVCNLRAWE